MTNTVSELDEQIAALSRIRHAVATHGDRLGCVVAPSIYVHSICRSAEQYAEAWHLLAQVANPGQIEVDDHGVSWNLRDDEFPASPVALRIRLIPTGDDDERRAEAASAVAAEAITYAECE